MPTTTRQLIRGALRLIGAVESGENMPANEAADALRAFNGMLSSWSLERLLVYHLPRVAVPTVSGQQVYTWGPGGEIPGERPLRLEQALLNVGPTGSAGTLEWPLAIWSQAEYERGVWIKALGSTYAAGVYLETAWPLARLHVWPVPSDTTTTLIVFPWLPLAEVADLDTVLAYPPGYERLLRYGLACEIAPEYDRDIPAAVASGFIQARTSVKVANSVVPLLHQPIQSLYGDVWNKGASRYDIRGDTP
jgi:hypothetical protein